MSNKKLYWTSSDFSNFFTENIPEDKLPRVNWGGFNLCITPIDFLDSYLCVVRMHITPQMYTNKIIPGIYPHKKFLEEIKDNNNFSKKDFSKTFMWNNWTGDDYAIYFIAKLKNGKIIPNNIFNPMVSINTKAKIQPLPRPTKPPFPAWIQNPYVTASDFRVTELDNKLITYDAYSSSINEVLIFNKTKQLSQKPIINSLCLPKDNSYPSEWNPIKDNEPYVKYFDKNWSIVGRLPSNIDKEKRILFLDWFYQDGIWGVLGDNDGFCNRTKLINFNKQSIPNEPTDSIPGFSFGSTIMDISHLSKLKVDKIGVGHIKLDYLGIPSENKYNKAFGNIRDILEQNFGPDNFIYHYKYAYAAFFYRIFFKDGWKINLSSAWFPILTSAKNMYHSLIYFPMSITRNLNNKSSALISGGYTDFHNTILEFPIDVIINSCTIDASNFSLEDFDINPIRIEEKS
jgi:hypothetical protein